MEAAVERFRLKRADVLVASDRKTSSSPRAQSQVVPAGTSHPRFSWHANMQLPRERDKSSRAASSKTAEQNCRLHCRQNRRRPAPCRPPGPPLGQWGVCPIARGIAHGANGPGAVLAAGSEVLQRGTEVPVPKPRRRIAPGAGITEPSALGGLHRERGTEAAQGQSSRGAS